MFHQTERVIPDILDEREICELAILICRGEVFISNKPSILDIVFAHDLKRIRRNYDVAYIGALWDYNSNTSSSILNNGKWYPVLRQAHPVHKVNISTLTQQISYYQERAKAR